jgi:hypothetical protein
MGSLSSRLLIQGKPIPGDTNRIEGMALLARDPSLLARARRMTRSLTTLLLLGFIEDLRTDARFLLIVEDHATFMRCKYCHLSNVNASAHVIVNHSAQ